MANILDIAGSLGLDATDYLQNAVKAAVATGEMESACVRAANKLSNALDPALTKTIGTLAQLSSQLAKATPELQALGQVHISDNISNQLTAAVGHFSSLQNAVQTTTAAIQEAGPHITSLEQKFLKLGQTGDVSAAELKKGWSTLSADLSKLSSGLVAFGGILTASVTAPIVAVGAAAIQLGSQFQQANIGFTTMLGSANAARQFLGELRDFAAATPFEFPELLRAAQRLKAMGFEAQSVIPIMRAVGDQVAAMGGNTVMIDRITLALGQMQAKGKVMAQEMNQLAEANVGAWALVADRIGVSIPEAMKLSEKGAISAAVAIPAILEGMAKKTGGMMDAAMKTAVGQWSNLKDRISFLMADIGEALLPIAATAVSMASTLLDAIRPLVDGFKNLPPPIHAVTVGVAALAAAAGPVILALGALTGALGSIAGAIGIEGGIAALGAELAFLIPVAQGVAVAVGLMSAAWMAWEWQPTHDAIVAIGDLLNEFWKATLGPVAEAIVEFGRGFAKLASDIAGSAIKQAVDDLKDSLNGFTVAIRDTTDGMRGNQDAAKRSSEYFSDLAVKLTNSIGPLNNLGAGYLVLDKAISGINTILKVHRQFLGEIFDFIRNMPGPIGMLVQKFEELAEVFNKIRNNGKSIPEVSTAMTKATQTLRAAEENFRRVSEAVDKGTKSNNDLRAATQQLQDAHANYNKELKALTPSLDDLFVKMNFARSATAAAKAEFVNLDTQLKSGKPVTEAYLAAKEKLQKATEQETFATNAYKQVLEQTGEKLKEYSGGVKDVVINQNKGTEAANAAKEAKKALRDEVSLLSEAYKAAESAFKRGEISFEQLEDAARQLQIAQDNLEPNRVAEHQVEANERIIKSGVEMVNWFSAAYPKIEQLGKQLGESALRLANDFSKGHEKIVNDAKKQIPIIFNLYEQLSQATKPGGAAGNLQSGMLAATIQKNVEDAQKLEEAYRRLHVNSGEYAELHARVASAAYKTILDSGKASATQLQEAELAKLKAIAEYYRSTYGKIPNDLKREIEKIETILRNSGLNQKSIFEEWSEMMMDVFRGFGKNVGNILWDVLTGKGKEELERQRQDLADNLAERTEEWERYQQDVIAELATIRAANAEELAAEVADLRASLAERVADYEEFAAETAAAIERLRSENQADLDEEVRELRASLAEKQEEYEEYVDEVAGKIEALRIKHAEEVTKEVSDLIAKLDEKRQAYAEYVDEVNEKLGEVAARHAAELAKEIADLNENLAEKGEAYQKYVTDINEKISDVNKDHAERLEKELKDLADNLRDKRKAYDDYVRDVRRKLGRITEDSEEAIEDETRETERGIDDKRIAYEREAREIQRRLDAEVAKGANANQEQIDDYRRSLAEKEEDYERYVARAREDLAEFVDDNKVAADRQRADLEESLREREAELAQYTAENSAKASEITAAHAAEAAEQIADLRESLAERTQEWTEYQAEIAARIAEARATHAEEQKKEEDELKESLARRKAELDRYTLEISAAINARYAAHAAELAAEEAELIASMERRRAELIKHENETAAKIEAARIKYAQELAEEEAKLNESLARRARELENYQRQTDERIAATVEKYAQELADEEERLRLSHGEREREHQRYLDELHRQMEDLEKKDVGIWGRIGAAGVAALEAIGRKATEIGVDKIFDKLEEKLLPKLEGVLEKIGTAIGSFVTNDLGKIGSWFVDVLGDAGKGILGGVKTVFETLFSKAGAIGKAVWDFVTENLSKIGSFFMDLVTEILPKVGSAIVDVVKGIGGLIGSIFGTGSSVASTAGGISGAVGSIGGAGGGAASAASGAAGAGIQGLASVITGAVSMITGVIQVIQGMHQSTDLGRIEENTRIAAHTLANAGTGIGALSSAHLPRLGEINQGVWASITGLNNITDMVSEKGDLLARLIGFDLFTHVDDVAKAVDAVKYVLEGAKFNDMNLMLITISGNLDDIKTALGDIYTAITNNLGSGSNMSTLMSDIKSISQQSSLNLQQKMTDVANAIQQGVTAETTGDNSLLSAVQSVQTAVLGADNTTELLNGFQGLQQGFFQLSNTFSNTLYSALGSMGGTISGQINSMTSMISGNIQSSMMMVGQQVTSAIQQQTYTLQSIMRVPPSGPSIGNITLTPPPNTTNPIQWGNAIANQLMNQYGIR